MRGSDNVIKAVIGMLLGILLIMIIGSLILEQFPSLQPLFDELKMHAVNLYNASIIKYGSITTILIIIAIFIVVGSSKKS